VQNGRTVARASALFLRRGDHPDGEVWSDQVHMPPLRRFPTVSLRTCRSTSGIRSHLAGSPGIAAGEWEQSHSRKFAWTRPFRPMVQGHPLTPFVRLAFAGDVTSSLSHWGTAGLRYINADYTITVSRLPTASSSGWRPRATTQRRCGHRHHDPVRSARAIGTSSALALAQPADAFKPIHK